MEAETAQDPFFSITKLCQPTASQEAKFPNFLLALESENFAKSNSEQVSSSPDPTPSEPDGIVMVSPPSSISSGGQQVEDDAVFHTPPEHHLPAYFSLEDQNLDELSSDGARTNGSKIIRVPGEEFGGETVPALDTEVIVDEMEGVRDEAEVMVVLDHADTGEEMVASDEAATTIVGKIDMVCEPMEDIMVNKGKRPHENSYISGSLDSVKSNGQTVELGMRHESSFGEFEKVAKRINNIDEFRYVGGGDGQRRREEKTGGGLGRRRQLPVSFEGKQKKVELKSGLLDYLDVLKVVFGDMDGGCKDVDFIGMAKSRGLTFPRPRWWSAEGGDE